MKKHIYLFCLLALCQLGFTQYVEIPDMNFRNALIQLYPTCFNSNQMMDSQCSNIKNATSLDVSMMGISNLDGLQYFTSLTSFRCAGNKLTSLPSLPSSLFDLNCGGNQLATLPYLPFNLEHLYCGGNQLTSFPSLPSGLGYLSCYNNKFTVLPELPPFLEGLFCGGNQLNSLPELPYRLKYLDCYSNQLTSLPTLPSGLMSLNCYFNQLTTLPTLPTTLSDLNCNNNLLTTLPTLPTSLRVLKCNNNQLGTLPTLPNTLQSLECSSNPNLKCLPYFPSTLSSLYLSGSSIKCIPNKPTGLNSTLPVCNGANNLSQCQSFPTVSGLVYLDSNKNGMYDIGEAGRSNIIVQLSATNYAVTDANGSYSIASETLGTFTLQTLAPTHYSATPSTQAVAFSAYTNNITQNIALQAAEVIDELSVDIAVSRNLRPGFNNAFKVSCQNTGTTYLSPTASFYFDENLLTIDSVSIPSTLGSGQVTVNLHTIVPGQSGTFWVYARVKTTAPLGDTLTVSTQVLAKEIQATKMLASIIRGSFDPNDKQATPNLSPTQFANGEYIDYTIRFQNTGTDTAFNVVVLDTLSNLLQNNSLQVVSSSHTVKTTVKNNIVSFEFLNINLEDSLHNEKASHGYVHFKVLPNTTVTESDVISNRAAIYFDYNAPVITNTTYTTFVEPLAVSINENLLNLHNFIYPNPATSKITVFVSGTELLSLYNSTGSLVLKQNVSGTQEIDIENLRSGFYYYTLGGKNGKLEVK